MLGASSYCIGVCLILAYGYIQQMIQLLLNRFDISISLLLPIFCTFYCAQECALVSQVPFTNNLLFTKYNN